MKNSFSISLNFHTPTNKSYMCMEDPVKCVFTMELNNWLNNGKWDRSE